MLVFDLIGSLVKIGLIVCFVEFLLFCSMASCKKKEIKKSCGIKVVAIERIKYKLVPVEVPHPNYLPDKKLTSKELKNAWQAFEYTAAARNPAATQGAYSSYHSSEPTVSHYPAHHPPNNHHYYHVEPNPPSRFSAHDVVVDHPNDLPHHPVPVPAPPIYSIHSMDQAVRSPHPLPPKHPEVIYQDAHMKVTDHEVNINDSDLKIKNQRRDTDDDDDADYSKDSSFKDNIYSDDRESGGGDAARDAARDSPYRDHVYRDSVRHASVYRTSRAHQKTRNGHKDSSMSKIKGPNSPRRRVSKRNYDYD